MSKIDKLAIQGIRSFCPDEPKRIEFYTPLTLILGQNGCGKTTIIESLKYITTGEFPPGCGKGGSFVHDPKIAKEPTVRGQIKLLFRNAKGEQIVGSRSLEVTQKAKKLECKTLDATLTYKQADGKNSTVSSKCIDFQTEVTSLLGVSKPILENVIFCHQEDANWPLDEGKKVKDKFDAIFNATKYIKCLDTIRKIRKEKKLSISNMTETLDALKSCKEQADLFKKDLKELQKDEEAIKEDKVKMQEKQNSVRSKLREVHSVITTINDILYDLKFQQSKLNDIKTMQSELRSMQNEVFPHSDFELHQMIKDFEQNTSEQQEKRRRLELNVCNIDNIIELKKKEESLNLQEKGKLEAAHQTHVTLIEKRYLLMIDLVSKYRFNDLEAKMKYSEVDIDELFLQINELVNKERKKLQCQKQEFEAKETVIQNQIDKFRCEETILVNDIKLCNEKSEELSKTIRKERHQLSLNENLLTAANLDDLKDSLVQISTTIEEEEKKVNISEVSESIKKFQKEEKNNESDLDDIRNSIANLNKQANHRSQLEIHLSAKDEMEKKIQLLKNKNSDDFQTIFKNPVSPNLRNELEAKMDDIRRQISENRTKTNNYNKKKTELEMEISNDRHLLSKKELEIKNFENKLQEICMGFDLDQALEKSKEQMVTLSKTKGDCESSLVMFKGFLNKLNVGEPCPLCHRDFDEKYHVDMLVEEINGKLNTLPQRLSKTNVDLKSHENKHEKLLQLKPLKDNADKCVKEIEVLRQSVKASLEKLEEVNTELENLSTLNDFLSIDENCGNRIHSDVITLDGYVKNVKQVTEKISNIQALLGDYGESVSMDELVKRQKELEHNSKKIRGKIDSERLKVMDHKMKLQKLGTRKNEIIAKELETRTKLQETEKLKERIDQLAIEMEKNDEKKEKNRHLVAPLKYKIENELRNKAKIVTEKESVIDGVSKIITEATNDCRSANEIHANITKYIEKGEERKLEDCRRKIENIMKDLRLQNEKKNELHEEMNKIDKELISQRERKRNLEDEKKIRDKEVESKKLQASINDLENKRSKYNHEELSVERQDLMEQEEKLSYNLAKLSGRLEELLKKKVQIEANLNNKGIKNAVKNYQEKLIQIKCLDVACNDLNKYYKALDTAIMKFHVEKMATINSIIRELWRVTYKGNDIDFIEIKTDEGESQGADKRRIYNYRVVMLKNDIEMDMRGRCSAGQKVLASLIIRMALAETFSSNCGILALDEPTTNLDRENIDSLSLALLAIVNKRAAQKNFQLIVITHDDEFLERLTRADFIEHYWKVYRDERGFSKLSKRDVLHV